MTASRQDRLDLVYIQSTAKLLFAILLNIMQCHKLLSMLCHAILLFVMLFYCLLCYFTVCYNVLCYATLRYALSNPYPHLFLHLSFHLLSVSPLFLREPLAQVEELHTLTHTLRPHLEHTHTHTVKHTDTCF